MKKLIFILFLFFTNHIKSQVTITYPSLEEANKANGKSVGKDNKNAAEIIQQFITGDAVTITDSTSWLLASTKQAVINLLLPNTSNTNNLYITFINNYTVTIKGKVVNPVTNLKILAGETLHLKYYSGTWYRL